MEIARTGSEGRTGAQEERAGSGSSMRKHNLYKLKRRRKWKLQSEGKQKGQKGM